jgi:hypothetical protein
MDGRSGGMSGVLLVNRASRFFVLYWASVMAAFFHELIPSLTVQALRPASRTMVKSVPSLALALLCAIGVAAQAPPTIATSTLGPQVGDTVPDFSGTDQFGRPHTLQSSLGPKGTMLVFFRSADW